MVLAEKNVPQLGQCQRAGKKEGAFLLCNSTVQKMRIRHFGGPAKATLTRGA